MLRSVMWQEIEVYPILGALRLRYFDEDKSREGFTTGTDQPEGIAWHVLLRDGPAGHVAPEARHRLGVRAVERHVQDRGSAHTRSPYRGSGPLRSVARSGGAWRVVLGGGADKSEPVKANQVVCGVRPSALSRRGTHASSAPWAARDPGLLRRTASRSARRCGPRRGRPWSSLARLLGLLVRPTSLQTT